MNKTITILLITFVTSLISPYILAEFRDPTQPPANFRGPTLVSSSSFILTAILTGKDRKIAVINGLSKRIGDEILGQYVTSIYKDTVQLEGPSGKITLFLFGPPIKDSGRILCKKDFDLCKDG